MVAGTTGFSNGKSGFLLLPHPMDSNQCIVDRCEKQNK
jgi:hypothetical protein